MIIILDIVASSEKGEVLPIEVKEIVDEESSSESRECFGARSLVKKCSFDAGERGWESPHEGEIYHSSRYWMWQQSLSDVQKIDTGRVMN